MEKQVSLHNKSFRLYKSEGDILRAVKNLAHRINEDYIGKRPLLIPVLNGSFMFASDLIKELLFDCEVSFVKAASYNGMSSSGDLQSLIGLRESVEGRHIIILEDIVDSGNTLARIIAALKAKNPSSIRVATLLLKPMALKNDIQIDYVGIEITNEFIVGYGLDYEGLGRNFRELYQEVTEAESSNN